MELCQMCVQALWDRDPVLLQLPHVTREIAMRAKAAGIETVFDLMEMDDDERVELLAMPPAHLADVARVCNRYPSVELAFEVEDTEDVSAGDTVTVLISLEREAEEQQGVPAVHAPHYPKAR
jgi:pre-mRNA-splicing helicase BRR2